MSFVSRSPRRIVPRRWAAALAVAVSVLTAGPRPSAADEPAAPAPGSGSSPGSALYVQYCQLCHAADATGYAADEAPSLVSPTFLESASDAFIARGIRYGRPNTAMATCMCGRRT